MNVNRKGERRKGGREAGRREEEENWTTMKTSYYMHYNMFLITGFGESYIGQCGEQTKSLYFPNLEGFQPKGS